MVWEGQLFNSDDENETLAITDAVGLGVPNSITLGCFSSEDDGSYFIDVRLTTAEVGSVVKQ